MKSFINKNILLAVVILLAVGRGNAMMQQGSAEEAVQQAAKSESQQWHIVANAAAKPIIDGVQFTEGSSAFYISDSKVEQAFNRMNNLVLPTDERIQAFRCVESWNCYQQDGQNKVILTYVIKIAHERLKQVRAVEQAIMNAINKKSSLSCSKNLAMQTQAEDVALSPQKKFIIRQKKIRAEEREERHERMAGNRMQALRSRVPSQAPGGNFQPIANEKFADVVINHFLKARNFSNTSWRNFNCLLTRISIDLHGEQQKAWLDVMEPLYAVLLKAC